LFYEGILLAQHHGLALLLAVGHQRGRLLLEAVLVGGQVVHLGHAMRKRVQLHAHLVFFCLLSQNLEFVALD